jgi:hypothetical protein
VLPLFIVPLDALGRIKFDHRRRLIVSIPAKTLLLRLSIQSKQEMKFSCNKSD